MEFEDILKTCGDYGRYQKQTIWGLLIPMCVLAPWFFSINIFMVSEPDHWCRVDQLANLSNARQIQLISPLISEGKYNKCAMYDIDYDQVLQSQLLPNSTDSLPVKECDSGFRYDHTNYDENAVTYYDWVCEKTPFQGHLLSITSIGTVIGTPFFGWLSDKIGRKKILLILMLLHIASSVSPMFVKDMTVFLLLRGVNSMCSPAVFQAPYVMTMEMVAMDKRTLVSMMTSVGWAVGLCILPGVVYLSRSWVVLTSISAASGLVLIMLLVFNREAPRWLLTVGRFEEAAELLQKMAEVNGKAIPTKAELIRSLKLVEQSSPSKKAEVNNVGAITLIKLPRLRRFFLLMTFCWIIMSIAYYGIAIHSINLHGNQFLNFFFLSATEIPGYFMAWWLIETRLGRRWTTVAGTLVAGVFLCLPAFWPPSWKAMTLVTTIIAKLGITITAQVLYQQAAELYPTPVRQQGLSMGSSFSAMATIFLPYLNLLSRYAHWIPMFVIGVCSLTGALVAAFLPETLNAPLPQTLEEGEQFAKGIPFWSLARTQPRPVFPGNHSEKKHLQLRFNNNNESNTKYS
ncbi:Organic cation transporter 1 [Halotydeus destructor]|nr:Organic cation transporter 1 [Halotydeus destructor]